jgi:hypothetical protein
MAAGKMIKRLLFLLLLSLSISIFSQEMVPVEHTTLYPFLERMSNLQILPNYNSFQIPVTRREAAKYLVEIEKKKSELDNTDLKILADLYSEFEFEIAGTTNNYHSQFYEGLDITSNKEKYLYYTVEPDKFNVFINLIGKSESIFINNIDKSSTLKTNSATLGSIGGSIRGSLFNNFYFGVLGTNGKLFGSREVIQVKPDLKYNFKINEKPDETFFDNAEGYAFLDFNFIKFGFSRQRMKVGNGMLGTVIDPAAPPFDYIFLNFKYGFFQFDYFHGKLIAQGTSREDSVTGINTTIPDKYIGYHRIGFNISKHFSFGIGEMIIYNRSIDLSYLNPLNFYKSTEHFNWDRDNSMLFVDFTNNSIKGLKLYSTVLIDDIDFGKIGKKWFGNQPLYNIGFVSDNLYKYIPLSISFQFIHVENYVYSHRLINNNYTSFGLNLAGDLVPNSNNIFLRLDYRFNNRLSAAIDYNYTKHGANIKDSLGNVIKNVGGDINLGARNFDNSKVSFLDGDIEIKHNIGISINYEPVNQVIFSLKTLYLNNKIKSRLIFEDVRTFFTLSIVI